MSHRISPSYTFFVLFSKFILKRKLLTTLTLLCYAPLLLFSQSAAWQALDSLAAEQYELGEYKEGFVTVQKCLDLVKKAQLPVKIQLPILLKEALFTEKLGYYRKADTLIQEVVRLFKAKKQTTHSTMFHLPNLVLLLWDRKVEVLTHQH